MRKVNLVMWNILSLKRIGAFKKLKDELHINKFSTAAVEEVRWCGSEIFDSGDFTICYSGNKDQLLFGTGFIIHKNDTHLTMDFNPESDRLCSMSEREFFLIQQ